MIKRKNDSLAALLKSTVSAQLHAFGCVLVLAGGVYLMPLAWKLGPDHTAACLSFLVTGFLVFLASAMVHFLDDGFHIHPDLRLFLLNLDHFGIYLFIAGTYTPFLLWVVVPEWRVFLLALIWVIAFGGILYTWYKPRLPPIFQTRAIGTGVFMLMGWTIIIRIQDVVQGLTPWQMAFLISGGAAYSIGAVVYTLKKPRLFGPVFGYHELWHLMVLLGATLHFAMIYSFYLLGTSELGTL